MISANLWRIRRGLLRRRSGIRDETPRSRRGSCFPNTRRVFLHQHPATSPLEGIPTARVVSPVTSGPRTPPKGTVPAVILTFTDGRQAVTAAMLGIPGQITRGACSRWAFQSSSWLSWPGPGRHHHLIHHLIPRPPHRIVARSPQNPASQNRLIGALYMRGGPRRKAEPVEHR